MSLSGNTLFLLLLMCMLKNVICYGSLNPQWLTVHIQGHFWNKFQKFTFILLSPYHLNAFLQQLFIKIINKKLLPKLNRRPCNRNSVLYAFYTWLEVCLPLSYVCVSLCLFVCLSVSASSFVCMFPSLSLQTSNSVSYGSQVWWIENQWKVTSFTSIFKMGFFSTPTSCTPSKAKLNFITCGRRPVISCSSQVQEAVSINSRLQWSQKIVTNAVVC